jgi:hypothetical protein
MITITAIQTASVLARLDALTVALRDMSGALERATDVVYEHTRQWYETAGGETWPPLAESTIQRKASEGYPDPERPLFAEGNLFESATSPYGPYSFRIIEPHRAVIGVDWEQDGWQIPVVLAAGNDQDGGNIPARPIWHVDDELRAALEDVLAGDVLDVHAVAA